MSILVITFALVCIAEHFVGFGSFLEFFLGFLVVGIFVGMVFERHLAVSLFDLIGACPARYSQNLVIIAFCHVVIFIGLLLIANNYFGKANYFLVKKVAFLHFVNHFILHVLSWGREMSHSLVKVNIKRFSHCLNF